MSEHRVLHRLSVLLALAAGVALVALVGGAAANSGAVDPRVAIVGTYHYGYNTEDQGEVVRVTATGGGNWVGTVVKSFQLAGSSCTHPAGEQIWRMQAHPNPAYRYRWVGTGWSCGAASYTQAEWNFGESPHASGGPEYTVEYRPAPPGMKVGDYGTISFAHFWRKAPATTTTTTPPTYPGEEGDNEAPVVKALASKGKPGRIAQLRYRLDDDSGFAKDEVWVYKGKTKKVIWRWKNDDFDEVDGDVVFARWKVPATLRGIQKFCVRAADEDGAQSPWSCSTIKITT